MAQIKLRIGTYTFALSPKEELNFDMGRYITTIDTIGNPTYQDVGGEDKTLEFTGSFVGANAWQQAELLESMMDAATPVTLVYGPIHRTVRIHHLSPKLKRFDRVDYDITLLLIPTVTATQTLPTVSTSITTPSAPSPPVSSTSAIAQYADKKVTVQSGQTLWTIAQAEYGEGSLWPIIAKVNGIKHENNIQKGQELIIPSKANIQKALNAYNGRLNAVITPAGIAYLQSLEAKAS